MFVCIARILCLFVCLFMLVCVCVIQDVSSVYQIFTDEVLGSGQFGVVYGGEFDVTLEEMLSLPLPVRLNELLLFRLHIGYYHCITWLAESPLSRPQAPTDSLVSQWPSRSSTKPVSLPNRRDS